MDIHPDPDLQSLRAESITSSSAPFIRPFGLDDSFTSGGLSKNITRLEKKVTQLRYQFYMALALLALICGFMAYHVFNNASDIGKIEEDKFRATPVKQDKHASMVDDHENFRGEIEKIEVKWNKKLEEALEKHVQKSATKEQVDELRQQVEAMSVPEGNVDSFKEVAEKQMDGFNQRLVRLEEWRRRNEILVKQIGDEGEPDGGDDSADQQMLKAMAVEVGLLQDGLGSLNGSINDTNKK